MVSNTKWGGATAKATCWLPGQMGWPGAHADGFQMVGSWGNTAGTQKGQCPLQKRAGRKQGRASCEQSEALGAVGVWVGVFKDTVGKSVCKVYSQLCFVIPVSLLGLLSFQQAVME